jgi:uncharacterized protein (TIGR02594 family)
MIFRVFRWALISAFLVSAFCLSSGGAEARGRHHHRTYSHHHSHHSHHSHRVHHRSHRHHVHHRGMRHGHHARTAHAYRPPSPALAAHIAHGGGGRLLAEAEKFVGSRNPTGFRGPWCGAFMGMIAHRSGVRLPTGYLQAREWAKVGHRVSGPRIGSIAVMRHHVGIVAGVDGRGNPILVSGNHGRRVGIGVYGARRVIAYVQPG